MFNPVSTTAYIFSKLGNSSSLLPIAVKDASHSAGITTASYITGKEVEGKDRFIDEFGTQAIWIGGIPFYKKIIDLTLYKIAKHNPAVDIRLLKDEKILKKAIEHAPTKEIAQSIEKAAKNAPLFKRLAMTKFIASTALTLGSYWGLTSFRHKHTEKNIIKQIKQEEKAKKEALNNSKTNQKPSFGMNLSSMKDFMFDPVKNMMIVDGGITAQRIGESRNPQDLLGYVIKEGSFWAFMYFAGAKIQEHFENRAEQKHNKSINLDIRALQDNELKEALKNEQIKTNVDAIKKLQKPEELYDFICSQKDNLVVKMAKKSDIIKTHKTTGKVDTQQHIDLQEVKGVGEKLEKVFNQYKSSNQTVEEFLSQTVKLKRMSIIKNIGTCAAVLGLVVPGIMLALRYAHKDNTEFAVKKDMQEKMKKEQIILA